MGWAVRERRLGAWLLPYWGLCNCFGLEGRRPGGWLWSQVWEGIRMAKGWWFMWRMLEMLLLFDSKQVLAVC
jgi:hypothetical protein